MSQDLIGQTLLNQFRVDSFVASGGMGAVYRVWDLQRNVPLAMKVLHADLSDDPILYRRFEREARALRKLAHPHIVPFYGLYDEEGLLFLLERFIEGQSLKDILRQRKGQPFSPQEVLPYLKALCSALGYAHASGVVHCDVKPGNVMVETSGAIYLTDFGVARHAESTTTTFGGAGTPAYMAPEQIRGEAVTPGTDIYSLGVMLFELLSGQRPFRGDASDSGGGATAGERIRQAHLKQDPPDPRNLNTAISGRLAEVVLKCLAKAPASRYRSANDLFVAACRAVGVTPESVSAYTTPVALPRRNIPDGQPTQTPLTQNQDKEVQRKFFPVWGWGGIVLGVVAIALFWSSSSKSYTPSPVRTTVPPVSITLTWTEVPDEPVLPKPDPDTPQPIIITDTVILEPATATFTPTNTTTPTRTVTPTSQVAYFIDFMPDYWALVEDEEYARAYDLQSEAWKQKMAPTLNDFIEGLVKVDKIIVDEVEVISTSSNEVIIEYRITFMSGSIADKYRHRVTLVPDRFGQGWLIDTVKGIK